MSTNGATNTTPHKATDRTLENHWFLPNPKNGSLTDDGLEFIAHHQYKAGTWTWLDNALNPYWTQLTDLLPLWLAPNMITTIGGLHCLASYLLTAYHSPNLDNGVPSWVILLNAYCAVVYYTLDCMDGKQARRTNSSSPLGQLFDHGIDCLCNITHVSAIAAYSTMGGSWTLLLAQSSLQFSFFVAQWEEYYTHVLPHACGNIGVTEVCYGLGLLSFINAFIDREAFWRAHVIGNLHIIHVGIMGWCGMTTVLVLLSLRRVFRKVHDRSVFQSALAKLISPLIIAVAPFLLPSTIAHSESRYISLAVGLCFSDVTIKMIVSSMAKEAYANIQLDVVPLVTVVLWLRVSDGSQNERLILRLLSLFYGIRLYRWVSCAIRQICIRLDINCFSIQQKKQN